MTLTRLPPFEPCGVNHEAGWPTSRQATIGFMFDYYLALWNLKPDGDPSFTNASRLLPVRQNGEAAMLKIATESEEKFGGVLMAWWDGHGAARVIAMDGDAILLERAQGGRSLSEFARDGHDDEATRIICNVIEASPCWPGFGS
jgi:streptomycin 6-kinase